MSSSGDSDQDGQGGGRQTLDGSGVAVRVSGVELSGNDVTYDDFILKELDEEALKKCSNVGELTSQIGVGLNRLRSHGIFKYADVLIDHHEKADGSAAPGVAGEGEEGQAGGSDLSSFASSPVDTVIRAEVGEIRRPFFRTDFRREVRRGEQLVSMTGAYRNAFGRGERIEASSSYGDLSSRSFSVLFSKPSVSDSRHWLSLGASRRLNNYVTHCSFVELDRGAFAALRTEDGAHTLRYRASWREISPQARITSSGGLFGLLLSKTVANKSSDAEAGESDAVRERRQGGPSLSVMNQAREPSFLSSLTHTFVHNTTDSPHVPLSGSAARVQTEVAGLGGDVRFLKVETDVRKYVPLSEDVSVGVSARCGVLRPWCAMSRSCESVPVSHMSDRFFLGGPLSLRGFRTFNVGPRDQMDAVGGDCYASAGVELIYRCRSQLARSLGVHLHAFYNVGGLVGLGGRDPMRSHVRRMFREMRTSVGVGLVLPTPFGRLEVNVVQPQRTQDGDSVSRYQIGIGAVFL